MSWNTKRDGYYSRPASNPLGSPVSKLEPHAGHTHAIIIPGTSYKCYLGPEYMEPQKGKAARVEALLKALSRTTVAGTGKRRIKASPVLLTIEEFNALNTEVKAA